MLTPTYHAFEMLNVHQDARAVPLDIEAPYYTHGDKIVPALSASASRNASGRVHVSLANLDAAAPIQVELRAEGGSLSRPRGRVLAADELDSRNTFDAPDRSSAEGAHWC